MQKNRSSIILGIDPGIADTGYGIISKDKEGNLVCLSYGIIKTSAKMEMTRRLELINQGLDKIIKEHKPKLMAVEQLFFCRNVKTALAVGQARGVVLLTAKQNKVPIVEFTPLQVKQAVAAYGQASKMQVQKMVKLLLKMDELPKPDDAADALAIAICATNSNNSNLRIYSNASNTNSLNI
ncbi:MAG: crossover junction endodeoxyribonuclease RuvC [Patescibacteria group bacterium]